MAFISTVDERYAGGVVSYSAGALDASNLLNFDAVIAESSYLNSKIAYGASVDDYLTADIDIYSLGVLDTGFYTIDVDDWTWDWGNYDSSSIASFEVLDGNGYSIGIQYSSYLNINLTITSSQTYYVKVTGPSYGEAQYSIEYTKTGELINYPATYALYVDGSAVVGETLSIAGTYFDSNGVPSADNLTSLVYWYRIKDGVDTRITGEAGSDYIVTSDDIGYYIGYLYGFIDSHGFSEATTSVISTAGLVQSNINSAPTVSSEIADASANEYILYSYDTSVNFSDADAGDILTYSAVVDNGDGATSNLPSWLSIDSATGVISGKPANDAVGSLDIKVSAKDQDDASVSDTYTLTINDTTYKPVVIIIDNFSYRALEFNDTTLYNYDVNQSDIWQVSTTGEDVDVAHGDWSLYAFSEQLDSGVETILIDVDSVDGLYLSEQMDSVFNNIEEVIVDWLVENNTDTIIYIPSVLSASFSGGSVPNSALQTLINSNAVIVQSVANVSEGTGISTAWGDSYSDIINVAAYNVDLNGDSLHGNPKNSDVIDIYANGYITHLDWGWSFGTSFATPRVAAELTNTFVELFDYINNSLTTGEITQEDLESSGEVDYSDYVNSLLNLMTTYVYVEIDNTWYSDAIPVLSDDVATSALPVEVPNDYGSASIYAITDAGYSLPINSLPILVSQINDVTIDEDAVYSYDASVNFTDVDSGDTATYTATLADDSALPSWLSITSAGVLSGTPLNANVGAIDVKVTHADAASESVSDAYTLTVANTNDAPVAATSPQITMNTSLGTIVFELNAELAPITVENILNYVNSGFYDDTLFHRVIPGFMVQGGGFTTGMVNSPTNDPIILESDNGLSNLRGTIAMARTSVPDSATSQFFINLVDNSFLDYQNVGNPGYAVFGEVVSGLSIIDGIAQVSTTTVGGYQNVPLADVVITSFQQTALGQINDTSTNEDAAYSYDASAHFTDVDTGDTLTYSAVIDNGDSTTSDLPTWLSINSTTGVLSGTPANSDVGSLDIKVSATDDDTASVSSSYTLTVNEALVFPDVYKDYIDAEAGVNAHIMTLKDSGSISTWGENYYGQLGDGTNEASESPVAVLSKLNFTNIATSKWLSVALSEDGEAYYWGNGDLISDVNFNIPKQIVGIDNATSISAGYDHIIILTSSGDVYTLGKGVSGELGTGDDNSTIPVKVEGVSNVHSIVAGYSSSYALDNEGSVWSWGSNNWGSLGLGDTDDRATPVKVDSLLSVTLLSEVAENDVLVQKSDGSIWAWGENYGSSPIKIEIPGNVNIVKLLSFHHNSFAISDSGELWGWGNGYYLGTGANYQSQPVKIEGITSVVDIAHVSTSDHPFIIATNDGLLWRVEINIEANIVDKILVSDFNLNDVINAISTSSSIQGTDFQEYITTLGGSNTISALAGNDTINLSADSTWDNGYAAQNVSNGSSIGTNEKITLNGLSRFSDVIDGGADIDTLNLTTGDDAFFIDDVYSDIHSSLAPSLTSTTQGIDSTARIVNLEVINAGSGNDIVDLTSTNFILANAIEINGEAGNDIL